MSVSYSTSFEAIDCTAASNPPTSVSQAHRSITKRNVEECLLVWFDTTFVAENNDSRNYFEHVQKLISTVRLFSDLQLCIEFIKKINNEKIFLLISNNLDMEVLSHLHMFSQIHSVYIVSKDKNCTEWTEKYHKIKGVFTHIESVCKQLKHDTQRVESTLTSINVMSPSMNTINLNSPDPSFMYSQLLKECVVDIDYDDKDAMNDFIDFCKLQYADNPRELDIITEFQSAYSKQSSIWWYTKECFLYKMMNKALRTSDIEVILKIGFFVQHLHRQIEQLHSDISLTSIFRVYRGQVMSEDDFEKMKTNVGGLLSFTSFLSTSKNEAVSIAFVDGAQNNADTAGVLFLIDIDPSIKLSPFAFVAAQSYFGSEDEVLFSMNTTFRICSVEMTQSGLWYVNLQLTDDDDVQLRELARYIRGDLQGSTALQKLAHLLRQMSKPEKSGEIYELLLARTDENDTQERAFLERQLGLAHHRMGDLDTALEHYQESLALKLTFLHPDHQSLAISYSNIAAVFQQRGNHTEALENYQLALKINLKQDVANKTDISLCYNNIGLIFRDQGQYSEALESIQRAMNIDHQYLPPTHPVIAMTYSTMSTIYSFQGDYLKAEEYSNKCLNMMLKCLPPKHLDFSAAHTAMAEALEGLSLSDAALHHAQLAFNILLQHSFPSTHCDTQRCQRILERIQSKV